MKKPRKHDFRFVKAFGEQLESVGIDVRWRRDGGFTAIPRMKNKKQEREEER